MQLIFLSNEKSTLTNIYLKKHSQVDLDKN